MTICQLLYLERYTSECDVGVSCQYSTSSYFICIPYAFRRIIKLIQYMDIYQHRCNTNPTNDEAIIHSFPITPSQPIRNLLCARFLTHLYLSWHWKNESARCCFWMLDRNSILPHFGTRTTRPTTPDPSSRNQVWMRRNLPWETTVETIKGG